MDKENKNNNLVRWIILIPSILLISFTAEFLFLGIFSIEILNKIIYSLGITNYIITFSGFLTAMVWVKTANCIAPSHKKNATITSFFGGVIFLYAIFSSFLFDWSWNGLSHEIFILSILGGLTMLFLLNRNNYGER